jgi:hypothetical protein
MAEILICSLDHFYDEAFESDVESYSQHYHVDAIGAATIRCLLQAMARQYDVIHLLCRISDDGMLEDHAGATLSGRELIKSCCNTDVKLLWVAAENNADAYIKGFPAGGKPINVVMTISRNGKHFSSFLRQILGKVVRGEKLPVAWTALVPQTAGPWQRDLPACIFVSGRSDVSLVP